jgi:hypothetical protein
MAHDDTIRAQAKRLYLQRGAAYAADQLQLPVRTIRRWALAEGWQHQTAVVAAQDDETNTGANQAAILGWSTRRRHMADQLGHVGAQLLAAIQRDLQDRKRLNLRDAGILLGITLDKAELLTAQTGGSDGRMDPEDSIARLRELLAGLSERREADTDG